MIVINTLFLSGWFQLILLLAIFVIYSRRVLHRDLKYGYALGWMIGLFFIFTYVALNPVQAFYLSAYDYALNIIQVFFASALGMMMGIIMVIVAFLFRNNIIQQSLSTAAIAAVFIIAIFMQLIATPDTRLMVSLFILAFGMVSLGSHIIMRQRQYLAVDAVDGTPVLVEEGDIIPQVPSSRLDSIRQRVMHRVNRNDVPTNRPNTL